MANDDIDRKIEFIVNQQARFSADILELKELHVKAEARMTNLEKCSSAFGRCGRERLYHLDWQNE